MAGDLEIDLLEIDILESEIRQLKSDKQLLHQENERLESTICNQKAALCDLKTDNERLHKEIERLRSSLSDLESSKEERQRDLESEKSKRTAIGRLIWETQERELAELRRKKEDLMMEKQRLQVSAAAWKERGAKRMDVFLTLFKEVREMMNETARRMEAGRIDFKTLPEIMEEGIIHPSVLPLIKALEVEMARIKNAFITRKPALKQDLNFWRK